MGDLGVRLRQAREKAGLSLPALSARTKIREALLDAIEREDFGRLPAGLIARGFLRAYAREVGLEPESIVRQYTTEFAPPSLPPDRTLLADRRRFEQASHAERARQLLAAAVVAAAGTAFVIYFNEGAEVQDAIRPYPIATTAGEDASRSDRAEEAPAERTNETPDSREVDPLTLDINPTAVVWVEATADGQRVLYQLIQRGERKTLHARDELVVRVGDAGAFQYWLNGERGRPLGKPTEVRDIRITRDNYATFQAP